MYRVQLQNFEGPLDLLLFFIKRDELDIYDIPIAYITDQFLEYIHFLDELDLGVASEFIYMASSLMAIKAKMMLPREKSEDDEIDASDPRYDLMQSLLEYKRFKEMGEEMRELDEGVRLKYRRGNFDPDEVEPDHDSGESLRDVSLFDLISAYRDILNRVSQPKPVHEVQMSKTNIEEKSRFIVERLRTAGKQSFRQLCESFSSRVDIIVMFLAVLEMIKERSIRLFLTDSPSEFFVDLPGVPAVRKD